MRADYHLHTHFSADCDTPMAEQYKRAEKLGLDEICFTDHLEYEFPYPDMPFALDIPAYQELTKTMVGRTRVKWGVEIGLTCHPEKQTKLADIVRAHPFDFAIASSHLIDDIDPYRDTEHYYGTRTQAEAHRYYMERFIEYLAPLPDDCYDAIGHVDYIAKFAPWPGAYMKYEYCPDELDTIFKMAVEKGKCIEINTSAYRKTGFDIPGLDWLKRYKELGGEFVTIGSDAHYTHHVGYRFKEAEELAMAAGIKYIATYTKHVPKLHPLSL